MKVISMKQLRQNFDEVKQGLERGEGYTLLYRSKVLGHLIPAQGVKEKENDQKEVEKELALVDKLAGGFKLGITFTPEELNQIYDEEVYG